MVRYLHTSAVTPRGLLLVGGIEFSNTTELMLEVAVNERHKTSIHQDGGAEESFDLIPGRSEHCSIQVNIKLFRKRTKYEKNCNKTCIALCCAFVPSVLIAQATNCSNQWGGGRSPNFKFVDQ